MSNAAGQHYQIRRLIKQPNLHHSATGQPNKIRPKFHLRGDPKGESIGGSIWGSIWGSIIHKRIHRGDPLTIGGMGKAQDAAPNQAAEFTPQRNRSTNRNPTEVSLRAPGGIKKGNQKVASYGDLKGVHKGIHRLLGKEGMGILFSLQGSCFHYRDFFAYCSYDYIGII